MIVDRDLEDGEILTKNNHKALYYPVGFTLGFITLEDNTDINYVSNKLHGP